MPPKAPQAPSDLLGRNAAARYIGVSPRTINRMVEREELTCDPDGNFKRTDLEEYLEAKDESDEKGIERVAVEILKDGLKQGFDHHERLMQLVEKPMTHALETVTKINENLLKRLNDQEINQIEYQRVLGDYLLQKEERDAMREQAAAKAETLRKAGLLVVEHLPQLLAQMGGKENPVMGALNRFASSLTAEQKVGLGQLAGAFEGEQQAQFVSLLKAMGIQPELDEKKEGEAA